MLLNGPAKSFCQSLFAPFFNSLQESEIELFMGPNKVEWLKDIKILSIFKQSIMLLGILQINSNYITWQTLNNSRSV